MAPRILDLTDDDMGAAGDGVGKQRMVGATGGCSSVGPRLCVCGETCRLRLWLDESGLTQAWGMPLGFLTLLGQLNFLFHHLIAVSCRAAIL